LKWQENGLVHSHPFRIAGEELRVEMIVEEGFAEKGADLWLKMPEKWRF
jgi:hypothetical protein